MFRCALFLFLLATAHGVCAQATPISDAPEAIQELASDIQGKPPDEVRVEIIKRFGQPQRDPCSGVICEEWDVWGGVLTFSPHIRFRLIFHETKTNKIFHLHKTAHPVGENVLGEYEMTTLPDPENHGSTYWLGTLTFGKNNTYQYTDSGQFPDHRAEQHNNFFMLYPTGTVKVRYANPVESKTLLESLPEGTVVAHLTFTSADRKHQATFSIKSSERPRMLFFAADTPLSFRMCKAWDKVRNQRSEIRDRGGLGEEDSAFCASAARLAQNDIS